MHQVDNLREAENFPYNSPPVPILMVYKVEINNGDSSTQEDALFNVQTAWEARDVNNRIYSGIRLKSHCETSVLVAAKATGLTHLRAHGDVSKRHTGMVARGIIYINSDRPIFLTLTNFWD